MSRTILAALVVAGLAACGKGSADAAADSTRSVALAGGDSSYALNDKASGGSTRPASGSSRTLASGTQLQATTVRTISSRSDKAGETFTALVASDVKDAQGRVVIPAGSTLNLTITELQSATDKGKTGSITVAVTSVMVAGRTYPVTASITAMEHTLKGRGVGEAEVVKTAAGVVIGGVAGRIIGGDKTGTIIGAVVGGAAGAAVAVETANRDVVVVAGTPLTITLNAPLTVAVQ